MDACDSLPSNCDDTPDSYQLKGESSEMSSVSTYRTRMETTLHIRASVLERKATKLFGRRRGIHQKMRGISLEAIIVIGGLWLVVTFLLVSEMVAK